MCDLRLRPSSNPYPKPIRIFQWSCRKLFPRRQVRLFLRNSVLCVHGSWKRTLNPCRVPEIALCKRKKDSFRGEFAFLFCSFGTKDAAVIRMRGKRRTSQKVHEVEPVADLSSAIQYTEKWSDHIDSFLLPAVTKAPVPEYDKHRFFQRVGGTYCAPPMEKSSLTRLPDIVDSNPA